MKNVHQLIAEISEYFIITAVLALPPLFVPHQTGAVLRVPSLGALLFYMAAALFLFLRARSTQSAFPALNTVEPDAAFNQKADAAFRRKAASKRATSAVLSFAARLLLCFCALACSAALWNRIAAFAGENAVHAPLPDEAGRRFPFFSGIIVLACYEEMLYRFFLPEKARRIVSLVFSDPDSAHVSRMFYALAEFIPICLFALAHRYLGIYAVGNALCAAVILRTAVCKKVPIFGLCAVHAAYNAAMLIALFNTAR
ncbi:hypothetical protein HMPREF9194_00929 [Treponema maltophilum ATCC 51939]|uniref:CAAX prenyl protease 2/Lysostaphin resistance protein A-like domain-containing protein n=1 Tax=Treponema maltophilum ATCC 51939 TaxID=1125699 RepID=S3KEG9_TREMA|nr:CPBP family glutamic-type intramembrane protease [Treponema maltophilum]EPF30612.1 hypothetical protein HMPREF9194_00929 [Treponema maltophilum ATCC 51939]